MTDPVLQIVELGMHWPTIDPFLFCAHHNDAYPAGTESGAPAASLAGRSIGNDFSATDGWSMYHGSVAPGFPQHPHRGFETVTYARQGFIDHSDSLGATARFGRGDVQWMTAGKGIVHCEMFPLINLDGPNPTELFQIWLNLPAVDKMVEPHFAMLWNADIPKIESVDSAGRTTTTTVIAGKIGDVDPPTPPPHSWANHADADVAIWHIVMSPGASYSIAPAAHDTTGRVLYLFEGSGCRIGDHSIDNNSGIVLDAETPTTMTAGPDGLEAMMLQGRPIAEPVAQYGPFVMNTKAEIEEAFADYQSTGFGGWPWASDDPTHGREVTRFARHADGLIEEREA